MSRFQKLVVVAMLALTVLLGAGCEGGDSSMITMGEKAGQALESSPIGK